MNKKIKALITGSFDPVTTGHLNIIERAATVFDEVQVVAFINPDKEYLFDKDQRLHLLALSCAHLSNVKVSLDDGMVCDYVKLNHMDVIVRGIRNEKDISYEVSMADINKSLCNVDTVFFASDPQFSNISSTLAREMLKEGRDLKGILPDNIIQTAISYYKK